MVVDGTPVLPPHRTCPGCGLVLPLTAVEACPECGRYWGVVRLSRAAAIADMIAAGTMFVVAIVATLPAAWVIADGLPGRPVLRPELSAALLWQSWVWGPPVAAVAYTWRQNVVHDRPGTEGLLRVYHRTQLAVLIVPFAIAMLMVVSCSLARW